MAVLGIKTMCAQIEERRLRGIAKQIGFLRSELHKENRKNMMLFLLGLTLGLVMNILIGLLSF